MSTEYINNQVDQIINDKKYPYPLNIAMASTWLIGNLKGVNLKVLDVAKQSSLADYFVMGSATNSISAKAMADEVIFHMKRAGHQIVSREGMSSTADWILLDIGDIIVHIFLESSRNAYDLDSLWASAQSMEIPQEFYSSEEEQKPNGPDGRGFF